MDCKVPVAILSKKIFHLRQNLFKKSSVCIFLIHLSSMTSIKVESELQILISKHALP